MNLPFISNCLPQLPSQKRLSNSALVLQELILPRICPKGVEAPFRAETPTYVDFENGGPANLDHQQLLGATEDPGGESGARRILDEIMECDNPFEPFVID